MDLKATRELLQRSVSPARGLSSKERYELLFYKQHLTEAKIEKAKESHR